MQQRTFRETAMQVHTGNDRALSAVKCRCSYPILSLLLCLALTSCGPFPDDKSNASHLKRNSQQGADTTAEKTKQEAYQIGYVIFGSYCAECGMHCATMYRYNCRGNANTLLVDSSDSYFKGHGKIVFEQAVTDSRRMLLAQRILQEIPLRLLTTDTLRMSFGCPDCYDGCGLYFELQQNGKIKKFYLDFQTEKLPGDLKKFAEFLKASLAKFKEGAGG